MNDRGVGQCPYPTRVCAFTLEIHFCLLLFLPFLGHRSFVSTLFFVYSFQPRSGRFLFYLPAFLRVEKFVLLSNQRLLNAILVILTQPFCLIRLFEILNLCACVRLKTPAAPATSSSASPSTSTCTSSTTIARPWPSPGPVSIKITTFGSQNPAVPVSRRRLWWSDNVG